MKITVNEEKQAVELKAGDIVAVTFKHATTNFYLVTDTNNVTLQNFNGKSTRYKSSAHTLEGIIHELNRDVEGGQIKGYTIYSADEYTLALDKVNA